MPFGEELPVQAQNSSNTRQFTGHERDGESGLDYMLARYSSSSINRFLSPDPQTFHTINPEERELFLENPQKWNQYSYVLNNPIRLTDPDGRAPSAAVKPLKARSWWEIIFDWVFRRGNPIDARSKVLDVTKAGIFFELQSVRAKAQGLYPPSTPISVEGEVELIDIIQSLNQLQAELGSADNEAELAKVKAELDDAATAIVNAGGSKPTLYRPPAGEVVGDAVFLSSQPQMVHSDMRETIKARIPTCDIMLPE